MEPIVSVIMPVYNAEKYLQQAIESILNQTFHDFEFLIFNDGSTDASAEIIRKYKDPRILFFDSKDNHGYVKHLNDGLRLAKGKYIARMDADDVSLPDRFEKQVYVLNNDSGIGLCGSWMQILGSNEIVKYPIRSKDILNMSLIENPFAHPAVMFRKDIVTNNNLWYEESYMPTEDYKLWTEFAKYSKLYNIPEVLIHYRRHKQQISSIKHDLQMNNLHKIRIEVLTNSLEGLDVEQRRFIQKMDSSYKLDGSFDLNYFDKILMDIYQVNIQNNKFDIQYVNERLLYIFKVNTFGNPELRFSKLIGTNFFLNLSLEDKFKFVVSYFYHSIL